MVDSNTFYILSQENGLTYAKKLQFFHKYQHNKTQKMIETKNPARIIFQLDFYFIITHFKNNYCSDNSCLNPVFLFLAFKP